MTHMKSFTSQNLRSTLLRSALAFVTTAPALADGTQMLGAPIDLAAPSGTRMIVAGVGVREGQPQDLNIEIPAGAVVKQVVAYWAAVDWDLAKLDATDEILLNGMPVVGKRIGDPGLLFNTGYNASYRADVTSLGLLAPGANVVAVNGVDFVWPAGGGLVAFIDDGGDEVEFTIFDGNDVLSDIIEPPREQSSVVTYEFHASSADRTGNLALFFASFFPTTPTVITLSIDGEVQEIMADAIGHDEGNAWDTVLKDVFIPAGATSLSVQLALEDSGVGRFAGSYASGKMAWLFGAFSLAVVEDAASEGCTPGYWKNHPERWDGKNGTTNKCGKGKGGKNGNDFTHTVRFYDGFNAAFGVTSKQSGLSKCDSLIEAMWNGGGGKDALGRHAAAALANADTNLDFPYTVDEVIALYRDAVGADAGPETVTSAKDKLAAANELGCPLN